MGKMNIFPYTGVLPEMYSKEIIVSQVIVARIPARIKGFAFKIIALFTVKFHKTNQHFFNKKMFFKMSLVLPSLPEEPR